MSILSPLRTSLCLLVFRLFPPAGMGDELHLLHTRFARCLYERREFVTFARSLIDHATSHADDMMASCDATELCSLFSGKEQVGSTRKDAPFEFASVPTSVWVTPMIVSSPDHQWT